MSTTYSGGLKHVARKKRFISSKLEINSTITQKKINMFVIPSINYTVRCIIVIIINR